MIPAYVHLVWKEYRAIRAFWLALVVLSLGLQFVAAEYFKDARLIVLNVALATPVFFAVGCIGTAFALEKEEGTYDWLRASPATDAQVLWSKLTLCLLGTVAMYAVLFPIALWLLRGRVPEAEPWHGMLALWPLAAVEAIAWGTLFSLRSERPLPAILLALLAASTVVHLAAMPFATQDFNFERYLPAIPLRLLAIVPVLLYDVYLGLKWLQPEAPRRPANRRATVGGVAPRERKLIAPDTTAYLHFHDRGMLLGHLLWQHVRQSWRLMLLLVGLQIAATILVRNSGLDNGNQITLLPLIGFAALMGASVFRPDQEQRSYRFFVEHNVPPRKVWLTRLMPWMVVATLSALFVCYLWVDTEQFARIRNLDWRNPLGENVAAIQLPPLVLSLTAAAMSFACGQWISMMVRSGLLAGFFTLLLSIVLTLWVAACFVMQLSWFWFVIPVPLIFFAATWLRAPDWIREDTSWLARCKAAAAVAVPLLLLCGTAPIVRVNQIPWDPAAPGFSVERYLAQITPEALAAGQVYRQANEALIADQDSTALDLLLQASAAPQVVLDNPATLVDWPVVQDYLLLSQVRMSADGLAFERELDQALERYFTVFKVQSDLANCSPFLFTWNEPQFNPNRLTYTFEQIHDWGAHASQTQELLRKAIAKLETISVDVLHAEDAIKSNYILCQRYIQGDDRLARTLLGADSQFIFERELLARFAPWEARREMRGLNLSTRVALYDFSTLTNRLKAGGGFYEPAEAYGIDRPQFAVAPHELVQWFRRWSGNLNQRIVVFESSRRASLIILACQAYQQKHGKLPRSLDDLVADPATGTGYLSKLPTDPFTNRKFVYFPDGPPNRRSQFEKEGFHQRKSPSSKFTRTLRFTEPCLWSPGWNVATESASPSIENPHGFRFQQYNGPMRSTYFEAWARGEWFPIPRSMAVSESDTKPAESEATP